MLIADELPKRDVRDLRREFARGLNRMGLFINRGVVETDGKRVDFGNGDCAS